jgi:hypothetical protein
LQIKKSLLCIWTRKIHGEAASLERCVWRTVYADFRTIFCDAWDIPEAGAADGVKAGEETAPLRGEETTGAHPPSQLVLKINAPAANGGSMIKYY